jgi:hypothetical protein
MEKIRSKYYENDLIVTQISQITLYYSAQIDFNSIKAWFFCVLIDMVLTTTSKDPLKVSA